MVFKERLFCLILFFTIGISANLAQDDASPLLEMLDLVPINLAILQEGNTQVFFADIAASIATRPGTPAFANLDEWEQADNGDIAYLSALPRTMAQFADFLLPIIQDDGASTGLRFFDIERTLYFGNPPRIGIILDGNFDVQAITDTLTGGNHEVAETSDSATLLCSVAGCDDGQTIDFDTLNNANPFGGNLGRTEPLVVNEARIINSPDFATVQQIRAAERGDTPSLAQMPDIRALVEVAYEQGTVRQAAFFAPQPLDVVIGMLLGTEATEEQIEVVREQLGLDDPTAGLPPYILFMLANTADLDAMTDEAHVLIAYGDEADAQDAAAKIALAFDPDEGFTSLVARVPLYDLMSEVGDIREPQIVYHDSTDQYVVVFTLSSPLPQALDETMSGIGFQRLLGMVFQRDISWLAIRATN